MARNLRGDSLDLSGMGDDEIRGLIVEQLREQPNLDADWIDVQVRDGNVTLSGRVGTDAEVSVAANLVTDLLGPEGMTNEIVVDETHRGERAEGADDAAAESEELERQVASDTGNQSDTADHLQENLEEEQWGTQDMQSAIQDGTAYSPPDHPMPDGYQSREEH